MSIRVTFSLVFSAFVFLLFCDNSWGKSDLTVTFLTNGSMGTLVLQTSNSNTANQLVELQQSSNADDFDLVVNGFVHSTYAKAALTAIDFDAGGGDDHLKFLVAGLDALTSITFHGREGNDVFEYNDNPAKPISANTAINFDVRGGGGNDRLEIREYSGGVVFYGNNGDDELIGSSGDDTLWGNDGNDILDGGPGADRLFGADGSDTLFGGPQADELDGGIGNDVLWGGGGNDDLWGDDGNDEIHGGAQNDVLVGGLGDDDLWGDRGVDTLDGDEGMDRLFGGEGLDYLNGGADSDELYLYTFPGDQQNPSTTNSDVELLYAISNVGWGDGDRVELPNDSEIHLTETVRLKQGVKLYGNNSTLKNTTRR